MSHGVVNLEVGEEEKTVQREGQNQQSGYMGTSLSGMSTLHSAWGHGYGFLGQNSNNKKEIRETVIKTSTCK